MKNKMKIGTLIIDKMFRSGIIISKEQGLKLCEKYCSFSKFCNKKSLFSVAVFWFKQYNDNSTCWLL